MSIGSTFYTTSVHKLNAAIKCLGLNQMAFKHGLDLLATHRSKYGLGGPSNLVVLWCEWSQLHCNDLRLGATMNVIDTPTLG